MAGPPEPLEGRDFWAGLDLASTFDTTAFVAWFPADDGFAERVQRQQREALAQAADTIDSLRARVTKLEHALADDGELPEELRD